METPTAASSDKYSTAVLVRRLLVDEALVHWRLYALALPLMLVAAAATALIAYLLGTMTNLFDAKNFHGILVVSVITVVLFTVKGFATYGWAVTLARVGNRIVADNQRRMFDKLLRENIGFFAD